MPSMRRWGWFAFDFAVIAWITASAATVMLPKFIPHLLGGALVFLAFTTFRRWAAERRRERAAREAARAAETQAKTARRATVDGLRAATKRLWRR